MTTMMAMLALTLFMRFGPDIPARRWLEHQLAERPVAALRAKERHHLIFLFLAGSLLLFGGEIVLMFGPEFALTYAADMALYLDIVAVGALVSSLARMREAVTAWVRGSAVAARVTAVLPARSGRARRVRRAGAAKRPSNDDGAGPGWALAA